MTKDIGLLSVAALFASTAAVAPTPSIELPSDDPAHFAAEAAQGRQVYAERCAPCHGQAMEGRDDAWPLADARFRRKWLTQSPDRLYTKIRVTMPQDDPGALSPAQARDVMAAILLANQSQP